jgi:hypothetical protein
VPSDIVASGQGFSFALPAALAEAAAHGEVRVTRKNGRPLPKWLKYVPATRSMVATSTPSEALPIEVLVRIGDARWIVTIEARAAD